MRKPHQQHDSAQNLLDAVASALNSFPVQLAPQQPHSILIALSGGLDSIVLLDLLHRLSATLPIQLSALHVHHGLSPNADEWAAFCQARCAHYQIPCAIQQVTLDRQSGLGIEAEARRLRYQALLDSQQDLVALAHHQDDQAETLLLQLMRGAGVKGMAGMAEYDQDRRLIRPLLNISRASLAQYAQVQGLSWVEDESNQSLDYQRNFCRHQIIPLMQQRIPAVTENLARSSRLMAEAQTLLDQLAQIDAEQYVRGDKLNVRGLSKLDQARAQNLLRWWLAQQQMHMPNHAHLQEIMQQLLSAQADKQLQILVHHRQNVGVYMLRRYQGYAYITLDGATCGDTLMWQGEPELRLPDGSRLIFEQVMGQGLALQRLPTQQLEVRFRTGGERFKPHPQRPSKTLKQLCQEINMPPWMRERLPLLFAAHQLVMIPNIGVAIEWQAQPQEMGLVIHWQSRV